MTDVIANLEEWANGIKKALEEIKKQEPVDRLSALGSIYNCCAAIDSSIKGWHAWLTNPRVMEKFSLEELKDLLDLFKGTAINLLEEDLKCTQKRLDERREESSAVEDDIGYIS